MKKRILAIFLMIILILFNNYSVFCVNWPNEYKREGGSPIIGDNDSDSIAKNIDTNPLDPEYNAKSKGTYVDSNDAYHLNDKNNSEWNFTKASGNLYATITLPKVASSELTNLGYVKYLNALEYNKNTYDVELHINKITWISDNLNTSNQLQVRVLLGKIDSNKTASIRNIDKTQGIHPEISSKYADDTSSKVAIETTYTIKDKSNRAVSVSGLFGLLDIDLNQGFYVNGLSANGNIYVKNNFISHDYRNTVKYRSFNSGTYIYSSHPGAIGSPVDPDNPATKLPQLDVYTKMHNVSSITTTFTFDNISGNSSLKFTLPKEIRTPSSLKIRKTDKAGNGLSGAEFKLYQIKIVNEKVEKIDDVIKTATTDGNGYATFDELELGRVYRIEETKAPIGYKLDSNTYRDVTINSAGLNTGPTFVNEKTTIKIRKVDKDDTTKGLSGAEFKLYQGIKLLETRTTDSNGYAIFSSGDVRKGGTYNIKETKAPAGYKLDSSDHFITLDSDGENIGPTITNEKTTIKITKKDDSGNLLDGAVFELYNTTTVNGKAQKTGNAIETKTTVKGIAIFKNVEKNKTYCIKETNAPAGYKLDASEHYIYTSSDGQNVDQTPFINEKTAIQITKKDKVSKNVLSGAKFGLYATKVVNGKREITGNVIEEQTTDANGIAVFKKVVKGNTYGIKEISAPTGYKADDTIHYVAVDADGIKKESPYENVRIIKLSGYVWLDKKGTTGIENSLYKEGATDANDSLMKDVTVKLFLNGTVKATTKTNNNGLYEFSGLEEDKRNNYLVQFEYNGFKFENVNLNTAKDNGSKASETERENFNSSFSKIQGTGLNTANAMDANGIVKHNIVYTRNVQNKTNAIYSVSDVTISAKTASLNNYWQIGMTELKNVNLGLRERLMANIEITKAIKNVEATINGYNHLYKYNTTGKGTRTRAIYTSDVNYQRPQDTNRELKLYITYQIGLKSNNANLKAKVQSITDYYDARLEFKEAGKKLNDDGTITELLGSNNNNTITGGYKKATISTDGLNINNDPTSYIYVKFQLNRSTIFSIMNTNGNNKIEDGESGELLENIVEINSYTSFDKNGNVYGTADSGSIPGNANPERKNETCYEKDTDLAPKLNLITADPRKTSGTLFIDESEVKDGIREGDGIFNEKDTKRLEGVAVTLTSISGNNPGFSRTVATDINGNFTISDFIPDKYTITYKWGDNKNGYDSKKYKATIYVNSQRANTTDWYKDTTKRYSEAMDDWNTRIKIDNNEIDNPKEMYAVTPSMILPIEIDSNATTISLSGNKYEYKISQIDFGIAERPEQRIQVEKVVKSVEIKLANGQTIAKAKFLRNGEIDPSVEHKYIKKMPEKKGQISIELDREILQGSTAYIQYSINVINNSEKDYYLQDFYHYGYNATKNRLNDSNVVKVATDHVIDYLDESLALGDDDWNVASPNKTVKIDGEKRIVIEKTNNSFQRLKPGENGEIATLSTSKLLSISGKLDFNNISEVDTPRAVVDTPERIYGRQPEKALDKSEEVVITNPTGEYRNYVLPTMIGISILSVIAIATITALIVIKKRKS